MEPLFHSLLLVGLDAQPLPVVPVHLEPDLIARRLRLKNTIDFERRLRGSEPVGVSSRLSRAGVGCFGSVGSTG